MVRATRLTIDTQALQHNLSRVRECAPQSKILAMVKANAYGHGAAIVARALSAADALGVASIEEAIELRQAGLDSDIVLAKGFFSAAELPLIEEHNLQFVLHSVKQVEDFLAYTTKQRFTIWLKLNTGMNRLGMRPDTALEQIEKLSQHNLVLMTHLATSDEPSSEETAAQLVLFNKTTQHLTQDKSLAASAAILTLPLAHADWVRPGIMLYGCSPVVNTTAGDYFLRPVMTLRSQIIAVQDCKAGEHVGYSGTYTCPQDMRIGVVAIGYGDGYPRHAPNGTPVLLNNKQAKIAGRVSMDMLTIDLREHPESGVGDEVILWGDGLPAEVIAEQAGTIAYELFCDLTQRVHREII